VAHNDWTEKSTIRRVAKLRAIVGFMLMLLNFEVMTA